MSFRVYWLKFLQVEGLLFLVAILVGLVFRVVGIANALLILGSILVIMIVSGEMGAWLTTRSPIYMYGSSVGRKSMSEDTLDSMTSSQKFNLWNVVQELPMGIFPLLVAAVIKIIQA